MSLQRRWQGDTGNIRGTYSSNPCHLGTWIPTGNIRGTSTLSGGLGFTALNYSHSIKLRKRAPSSPSHTNGFYLYIWHTKPAQNPFIPMDCRGETSQWCFCREVVEYFIQFFVTKYASVTLSPALLHREVRHRAVFLFSLYQFQNNLRESQHELEYVVKFQNQRIELA